jgi:hypothetical protein
VQSKAVTIKQRRLNHVSTGKWVEGEIENFCVVGARFRVAHVATHPPNDFLVQMPHEAFEDHKRLMRYRRADRLLEVAFAQQGLVCGQEIGVEHVAGVAPDFNVCRRFWQISDDTDNLRRYPIENRVRAIEGAHELGASRKVLCLHRPRRFRHASAQQHPIEKYDHVGQFEVCREQFRRFVTETGYVTDGERAEGGYGFNEATLKGEIADELRRSGSGRP